MHLLSRTGSTVIVSFYQTVRASRYHHLTIAHRILGHACLFQYTNLFLSGYKAMTWEQLLSYHSERPDSLCPGHPEIEHEGIELTTGPLGQGIANAVGLAMATKHLSATFNRPEHEIISNHTWCMVGDACMQEGVGCEAFSYAGHLKLNNLTVIYDNNQVSARAPKRIRDKC